MKTLADFFNRVESFVTNHPVAMVWGMVIVVLGLMVMTGCRPLNSDADDKAEEATEATMAEAWAQTGMPDISNYNERKLLKMIYELRDQEGFATETFITTWQGQFVKVCDSFGYGIPYSAQYSNPERPIYRYNGGYGTLPQPEPNGIWLPTSSSATFVLCQQEGKLFPVYVESDITVVPFEVDLEFSSKRGEQ